MNIRFVYVCSIRVFPIFIIIYINALYKYDTKIMRIRREMLKI